MSRKRVAVLGASKSRQKYGNKAVRAFAQLGCDVYPVNPRETEIEGWKTYADLASIPCDLDMVTVYLLPETLLPLLPEIAGKGCRELWLNPGSESDQVVQEAERLGLNVIQACSVLAAGLSAESF